MNIITRTYESLLPFLVVEAITSSNVSFNSMSVRMMSKGWAWLVSGRKLLIWKFVDSKTPSVAKARRTLSPCFELQLPQCDLVHRAELIQAFFLPQNPNMSSRTITVPAALAVSPEGTIRFWSNITNERFTEAPVVDMAGQEFCTLVPLSPLEYLLGTTTGSVFLLTIDITNHDPKGILVCSSLTAQSKLLSGIRRMTNLFFGPMTADVDTDSRRPLIAVPKYSQSTIDKTGTTDRTFFVMSSSFKLRQWSRTNEGVDSVNHLIKDWDLQRNLHLKITSSLQLTESDNLNFWPIDMITTKSKELLILIVILDTARDNTINYATCIFNPYQLGDSIASLTVLRSHSWHYSNETEDQLLSLRFLERRANNSLCFMYDRKFLFLVKVDEDVLDAIDYGNQDDGILGAGLIDSYPILFTQRDGLTYVVPIAGNRSQMHTMNETSIQLEPPTPSRANVQQHSKQESLIQSTSTRIDPMIIEIDVDEDEENAAEKSNAANQSRQRVDRDKSTTNNSLDQSNINKSVDQSARRKVDDVAEILKENKEFEWVQQIDMRQYGLASETLAKLSQESEILSDRKDTLLALSKLAKLAE